MLQTSFSCHHFFLLNVTCTTNSDHFQLSILDWTTLFLLYVCENPPSFQISEHYLLTDVLAVLLELQ